MVHVERSSFLLFIQETGGKTSQVSKNIYCAINSHINLEHSGTGVHSFAEACVLCVAKHTRETDHRALRQGNVAAWVCKIEAQGPRP